MGKAQAVMEETPIPVVLEALVVLMVLETAALTAVAVVEDLMPASRRETAALGRSELSGASAEFAAHHLSQAQT